MRAMIDIYALMAIPMGFAFKVFFQRTIWKTMTIISVLFFIALNIFQSWQYSAGILHYDAMTMDAYFDIWDKTSYPDDWGEKVRFTDPVRSLKGLPEEFTIEELRNGHYSLRASNIKYLSAEFDKQGELSATRFENREWEVFEFSPIHENMISLRGSNGKYVSADRNLGKSLIANRDWVGDWETFELIFLGDNKIALKASNGKYVSLNKNDNDKIRAAADQINANEIFSVYMNN